MVYEEKGVREDLTSVLQEMNADVHGMEKTISI